MKAINPKSGLQSQKTRHEKTICPAKGWTSSILTGSTCWIQQEYRLNYYYYRKSKRDPGRFYNRPRLILVFLNVAEHVWEQQYCLASKQASWRLVCSYFRGRPYVWSHGNFWQMAPRSCGMGFRWQLPVYRTFNLFNLLYITVGCGMGMSISGGPH